ncbi:MAG: hypothetical protein ABI604_20620 [Nitrospirota bacterium]
MHAVILVLLLAIFLQPGCNGNPTAPLDMTAVDSGHDHKKIAAYYHQQAVVSRQQAEELIHRAVVYERLFGRESEWVSGTRLLAQYYEEAARQEEELARRHLNLLGDAQTPSLPMCDHCR